MKQYKVLRNFSESNIGDIIWLNDRRAKSELRNGNIELKEEKRGYKTKEEKVTKVTKRTTNKNVKK